ncbi:YbaB/EbfC family nucleoid-associated protein [Nocardia otitidiscaviarum]|uniref:YbaB/EbfC family nucleoid-associated protein n=1 Tax=Nocardia otitidiscaviarum TaxID=1823 RepID=UPI00163D6A77|nr:YbaB/EbfC family nucleoid-associated protein [Nocardia otitidiscaviarum]MCP9625422.1 YbaB/EbfC family nucleoid-associated protein [Nocardia otitidiscaviarum]
MRAAQAMARELRHRALAMREKFERIVARRPSPSGMVIPEVNAKGQLLNLYLAPGTCARFDSRELVDEIMAAVLESTNDARQQYRIATSDPTDRPRPLGEIVREWRSGDGPKDQIPNFGKQGE